MSRLHIRSLASTILLLLVSVGANASGIAKGPYLQNPTTSSITICWVTDADSTGVVRCQQDVGKPTIVSERASTRYHRVKVEKLKPNTYYGYSVTCEGETAKGTFRTAASPGRSFRFVVYGDNRTQPLVHAAVLKRMEAFKADFMIQTGDLVANGENIPQWDEYWRVTGPTLASLPIYPTLGNHERNGAPYFQFFAVPRDYSFDYGDAHFVALDTNHTAPEIPAQMEWLKKDLAAHQKAAWRVVFMHHTLYTCVDQPRRLIESEERRKYMLPVLKEGHVLLVLSGHDHNYQRHLAEGITFLVTGGGGAPLYGVISGVPSTVTAKSVHHHCEVTADKNRMQVRAVQPDGAVIDEFEIKRG